VVFAGIVNSAVLDPFENITNGSLPETTLFEVNAMLNVPAIGFGCGVDIDMPIATCCAGSSVIGALVRESTTNAETTSTLNSFVAVWSGAVRLA